MKQSANASSRENGFIAITTQDGIQYECNTRFFLLGLIVSVILLAVFAVRTRFFHSSEFFGVLVLVWCIGSGFSFVSGANYVLDHDPPIKTGTIQNKEESTEGARSATTTYSIYVKTPMEYFSFTVRSEYYDRVMIGDEIAIAMHSGGLGIPFADIVEYK